MLPCPVLLAMCDAVPYVIYDTPVALFRDRLPEWLADDAVQAAVLDAVMQVLATAEDEADVKLILAACREHCTPQPALTGRLLSAMSECSVAAHKCLVIEQLPHFCTSTAEEVSAAIAACSSEYNQQPALRLPIIAALAAMHIPQACQQQLVAYINDALASASPADYSTLLRSALRCLPLSAALPLIQTMRRLSLTIDCNTAGQLLHTLMDVRAVSGDKVMAWVEAVEASKGEMGVLDVLVLIALLAGGEDEEEAATWRCLCRCVAAERLTLRTTARCAISAVARATGFMRSGAQCTVSPTRVNQRLGAARLGARSATRCLHLTARQPGGDAPRAAVRLLQELSIAIVLRRT